jgi:rhodanese-related sulfurtransferase
MACAVDPALALRDRAITLYCRTGGRSALAADALQQMGFSKVRSMAGGITAWTERGHPVTTR